MQKLLDTQQVNTSGVKPFATLTKFPEFGGTAQIGVSAGGSATVQLRGWVAGSSFKEVLATFTLPVPSGSKANDLFDSAVIASQWENGDWNVLNVTGTLTLSLAGLGI